MSSKDSPSNDYLLITPVHNEQDFIAGVLRSVVQQTVRPARWVIVDDRSTDRTGAIVRDYAERHPFIEYYRLSQEEQISYYGRRTGVVLAGYRHVRDLPHAFVAVLDADIELPRDYYENLLRQFAINPRLGIASGVFYERFNGHLRSFPTPPTSTSGGLHMFRRRCYDAIGGYRVLKYGNGDGLADLMARMQGWQTRSFRQYKTIHYRPLGTRNSHHLQARFRQGLADYVLGSHPLFSLMKNLRRMFLESPYFFSAAARLCGFLYGYWSREPRVVSPDLMQYHRREQLQRIVSRLRGVNGTGR
ncbi:MAG: glycosyltransferase family 2 protein [Sedimentisphaerales bacterium]|nr:glycosyltransferase family 2 protein [Sedimentisphaerales bacterium]